MEDKLALRIRLFRESGQVRAEVAEFVSAELGKLAHEGHTVSEDTAGMLTSHLMMALTRLLDGAPAAEFPDDAHITAELAAHPGAVERSRGIATRAEQALGASLPDSEISFLAMHLAVLDQHSTAG